MIIYPEHLGLETLFVQLFAILAEIDKNRMLNNAALICIQSNTWDILLTC